MCWVPMGKTIANIYRYAQVSSASNKRYLDALTDAIPTGEIIKEIEDISQRKKKSNRFNQVLMYGHPKLVYCFQLSWMVRTLLMVLPIRITVPISIQNKKTKQKKDYFTY